MKLKDLSSQTFGDREVLERAPSQDGITYWRVKCKCGEEQLVKSQNLRKSTSCHKCSIKRRCADIQPDDNFGDWTVVKFEGCDNGTRWLCRCKCGEERVIPHRTLNHGTSTCCFKCGRKKLQKFTGAIPKWMVTSTKRSAAERKLCFDISIEYLAEKFTEQVGICPLTGLELKFSTAPNKVEHTTASIDRIDSSKGYIVGNVRFVHKRINIMRSDMSDEEFVEWCQKVAKHSGKNEIECCIA